MKEDNNLCNIKMENLCKCNYYKNRNMNFREAQVNTEVKKLLRTGISDQAAVLATIVFGKLGFFCTFNYTLFPGSDHQKKDDVQKDSVCWKVKGKKKKSCALKGISL